MNERKNRFIIFPEDSVSEHIEENNPVEMKKTSDEHNTVDTFQNYISENFPFESEIPKEDSNESVLENVIEVPKIQETKETDEGLQEDKAISDSENIIDELGEIGYVNRDEEGRIVFDDFSKEVKDATNEDSKIASDFSKGTGEKSDTVVYSEKGEENISTGSSKNAFQSSRNLQDMINKILKIDDLAPVMVHVPTEYDLKLQEEAEQRQLEIKKKEEVARNFQQEIYEVVHDEAKPVIFKSDLLDKIQEQNKENGAFSILTRYGEDYCSKDFVTNPAIGRDEEIKQLILTLLTPEKSAILIGKPGIGKTSIVEGLAYRLQRGLVPEALQGFTIINVKTPSLVGTLPSGETRLQTLVDELKRLDHVILFIDEIHMLIGATDDSAMDFANMFKEGLGRGQIKIIGATTTEEYEHYILRDKAFVRRFQSIDIKEPTREHTIKILMGTLPKIEKDTHAKLKYTTFIQSEIMAFIVDITSEYKRVYGIGSRYPDICLTLLKEAFSQCIFENRDEVTIFDIRNAIKNSKNIYPDVIRKELPKFDDKFKKIIEEEQEEDASIEHL